jgi:cyclic beta-1,2-glucan synthetase
VTATFYAELVQGESRDGPFLTAVNEYDEGTRSLLTRNPWAPEFASRTVFLASSEPTHGFTVDRGEFLGRHHGLARPAALERWGLSGNLRPGVDPCQTLMVHVELAPGEERDVWFLFGEGEDREASLALVQSYREGGAVEAAWNELKNFWDGFLGSVEVKTPEPAMDLLLNRWLPYQLLSSRIEGRAAFYQSSGGFGFRDQLQDVMALVHSAPELARAHILEAAAHQFSEGDVLHWWHPPENQGVRTRCSDDLLWLPYVTAHYVRATGDRAALQERIPYLDAEPLRKDEQERYGLYAHGNETGTLLEHCRRAIEHGLQHGPNGLPAMGAGDWNDGMNRVGAEGRGESVWLAWFACCALEGFASLLESEGQEQEAAHWRRVAADLLRATEDVGWDGEWYLRAWYDDGTPIGSRAGTECQVDLIAQAWAALAGASEERTEQALASAQERLVDERQRVIRLLAPPFRGQEKDPGYIASYPPGVRENGGQYTHAATWLGWAHVKRGDGDAAERVFRLLNPALRVRDPADAEKYRVEPYVLAGDVYAVDPHLGRGGWTWYTGAASWMWRLGVEGILGLERVEGDLVLDPTLPTHWSGFEAVVRTAHCECKIVVERVKGCERLRTYLDGEQLSSGRIPLASLSGHHEARIEMPFAPESQGAAERAPVNEERSAFTASPTRSSGERLRPRDPENAKRGE